MMGARLARLAALVGSALVLAACSAALRGVPWKPDLDALEERAQRHEAIHTQASVELDEFLALIDQGAIVIDARSPKEFEHGHLAAWETIVLNVPGDEAEQHVPRLAQYVGNMFVIYCTSATCDASAYVYDALVAGGFDPADIVIYGPGWEGILAAGLETASGPEA